MRWFVILIVIINTFEPERESCHSSVLALIPALNRASALSDDRLLNLPRCYAIHRPILLQKCTTFFTSHEIVLRSIWYCPTAVILNTSSLFCSSRLGSDGASLRACPMSWTYCATCRTSLEEVSDVGPCTVSTQTVVGRDLKLKNTFFHLITIPLFTAPNACAVCSARTMYLRLLSPTRILQPSNQSGHVQPSPVNPVILCPDHFYSAFSNTFSFPHNLRTLDPYP